MKALLRRLARAWRAFRLDHDPEMHGAWAERGTLHLSPVILGKLLPHHWYSIHLSLGVNGEDLARPRSRIMTFRTGEDGLIVPCRIMGDTFNPGGRIT